MNSGASETLAPVTFTLSLRAVRKLVEKNPTMRAKLLDEILRVGGHIEIFPCDYRSPDDMAFISKLMRDAENHHRILVNQYLRKAGGDERRAAIMYKLDTGRNFYAGRRRAKILESWKQNLKSGDVQTGGNGSDSKVEAFNIANLCRLLEAAFESGQ